MLPIFHTDQKELMLMQTRWASLISPILDNPSNDTLILKSVSLLSGDNTINHLLGRKLQGWKVIRQRAAADLFDKQDTNPRPELTLILNASAPVVIDLECF